MTEEEKEAIKTLEVIKVCGDKGYIYNFEAGIIQNLIQKQQEEIEKKDKTILKMAKAINNFDIDEDICKQMGQKKYCSEYEEESKCEKCIIEYFEKKEG